jgi:hypothetical protein
MLRQVQVFFRLLRTDCQQPATAISERIANAFIPRILVARIDFLADFV